MTEAWTAGAAVERLRVVRAIMLADMGAEYVDHELAGDGKLGESLAMLREALGLAPIFTYSELNQAIATAEAGAQGAPWARVTDDWPDDGQPTDDRPDDGTGDSE